MQITETKRLIIREYTSRDRTAAIGILTDEETMAFWPSPYSEEQAQGWLKTKADAYQGSGLGRFAVVLKAKNQVIGDAGIVKAEVDGRKEWDLGYIIHASHWGQGYGKEVAGALLDYAFRYTDLERIIAHFAQDHRFSRSVAEGIGMQLEKTFVHENNLRKYHDLYAIDRKTFVTRRRERLIERLGGSVEKKNWLGLATSFSLRDRLLALEMAEAIKEQIQRELLYWFCNVSHFTEKLKLYGLLDEEHQAIALNAFGEPGLPPLDGDESFRYFMVAPDQDAVKAQATMEARKVVTNNKQAMYPLPEGKMQFLKLYSQLKGISMGRAKETLVEIFNEVRNY